MVTTDFDAARRTINVHYRNSFPTMVARQWKFRRTIRFTRNSGAAVWTTFDRNQCWETNVKWDLLKSYVNLIYNIQLIRVN